MDAALRFGNKGAAAFLRFKDFSSEFITNIELSENVKESLALSLENGLGFYEWRKGLNTLFDSYGIPLLKTDQAEIIYCTESSLAFGAHHFTQLQNTTDRFPYWQYATCGDERVRESHRQLDGKIFWCDDFQFFPPLGLSCRCRAISVSIYQAERLGIKGPDIVPYELIIDLLEDDFFLKKKKYFQDWIGSLKES